MNLDYGLVNDYASARSKGLGQDLNHVVEPHGYVGSADTFLLEEVVDDMVDRVSHAFQCCVEADVDSFVKERGNGGPQAVDLQERPAEGVNTDVVTESRTRTEQRRSRGITTFDFLGNL